jgi:hypothetical protein
MRDAMAGKTKDEREENGTERGDPKAEESGEGATGKGEGKGKETGVSRFERRDAR